MAQGRKKGRWLGWLALVGTPLALAVGLYHLVPPQPRWVIRSKSLVESRACAAPVLVDVPMRAPDGRYVYHAAEYQACWHGPVKVYDRASGRESGSFLDGLGGPANRQYLSWCGRFLVLIDDQQQMHLVDAHAGKLKQSFATAEDVTFPTPAFSPRSTFFSARIREEGRSLFAVFCAETGAKLWSQESGEDFVFAKDDKHLFVRRELTLDIWNAATWTKERVIERLPAHLAPQALEPPHLLLSTQHAPEIVDYQTGERHKLPIPANHWMPFTPLPTLLLSQPAPPPSKPAMPSGPPVAKVVEDELFAWEIPTGKPRGRWQFLSVSTCPTTWEFSPNNSLIVFRRFKEGTKDKFVWLWKMPPPGVGDPAYNLPASDFPREWEAWALDEPKLLWRKNVLESGYRECFFLNQDELAYFGPHQIEFFEPRQNQPIHVLQPSDGFAFADHGRADKGKHWWIRETDLLPADRPSWLRWLGFGPRQSRDALIILDGREPIARLEIAQHDKMDGIWLSDDGRELHLRRTLQVEDGYVRVVECWDLPPRPPWLWVAGPPLALTVALFACQAFSRRRYVVATSLRGPAKSPSENLQH